MTAKQRKTEAIERSEMLKRHWNECVALEKTLLEEGAVLDRRRQNRRGDLSVRQLRETFQLREKYGHPLGAGATSILDGTYNRRRR